MSILKTLLSCSALLQYFLLKFTRKTIKAHRNPLSFTCDRSKIKRNYKGKLDLGCIFRRRRSNFETLMRIFRETSTAFPSFSANHNILPRPILPKNAEHERREPHQIMAHAFFTGPNKVNREVSAGCIFVRGTLISSSGIDKTENKL